MLLPLLTWSWKKLHNYPSSCKCFVLPVGTHLRIFTALKVSPRLPQVTSLKDSAGTTFSSKLSSCTWNRFLCSTLVKRKILSNHDHFYTKLSEFKFCVLSIPCRLKQCPFFFHSCDIEWVPIHYLHKKWWLIFQSTDWQKCCGWLFLMMIIFVDGLFAVLFKCSPSFDSWCCPGNWAAIP